VTGPIMLPGSALQSIDAIAARDIIDADKFNDGISKIIDSTVQCLNASTGGRNIRGVVLLRTEDALSTLKSDPRVKIPP
jgi:hypothetical protein